MQFWATLVQLAEKSPPPGTGKIFLGLDVSISCNFEQLWFSWQKSPPRNREQFFRLDLSIWCPGMPCLTLLVPSLQDHHAFWFVPMCTIYRVVKSTSLEACCHQARLSAPCCMHHIYMKDLCCSVTQASSWFKSAKKPPPLFCLLVRYSACIVWHKVTLHNHIPCIIKHHIEDLAEKPPPQEQGKFLDWIYPFHAISSNFHSAGRKAPPQEQGNFFRLDVSISCNFEQLWFSWQKPPLQEHGIFFRLDLSISGNFEQLWFQEAENPPHQEQGKYFFRLDLSISCNFEQLWFQVAEKLPPPRTGKFFLDWMYPFHAILSNFGSAGRKAPPLPPGIGKIFLDWMYPFHAILSNFGLAGRKSPPPPPPRNREQFFRLDLSIWCNFKQLWFSWQKRKAPPPGTGNIFLDWIYPFHAISSNFGFRWQKSTPPPIYFFLIILWTFQGIFSPNDFYAIRKTTCRVR